jgi:glycosyltransferase involved in cell wall biosynthesis
MWVLPPLSSDAKRGAPALPTPLVSLLVCTYNRADVLGQTLESLLVQEFGWGEFEIIVVDNASTDQTKAIIAEFQARDPRLRYVYEPRLGVAIARNTGARLARAPYIAYFDDDLIAEPDCLYHLMAPFWQVQPAPAAVMGKVNLQWDGIRPAWFPEKYETLLSRFDRGDKPRLMTPHEYLITMNVAFERETFLQAGGIREDLSRKGRMFICSGDNDIFNRYIELGLDIFYQPCALVWHLVPKPRQNRRWLFKRVFGEGTSQVIADYNDASRYTLFRRLLYDGKVALKFCLDMLKSTVTGEPAFKQDSFMTLVRQVGRLSGELQLLAGMQNVKTLSE